MTSEQQFKIEALKYAVYLCDTRKGPTKTLGYNVACEDIKVFLEAAIERVSMGEDMNSYAYVSEV